ncbi:hypothetical protein [Brevibacterium spongiae]|uniref:DUF2061 domain-containing protein n=1 Tax=Brevibacterium spongiae TaxID=2909672 RepID=A0ABY5SJT8_9MICO|nr:hypothetical protein [Brevibacterium spongiae]UVI34783.1 hypothetical protein L1F31_11670 [Brevibacterium spongiae]
MNWSFNSNSQGGETSVVELAEAPKSLTTLRSHHLNEAIESVVCFSGVACIFWVLDFGTVASPSVPEMLVTITLPIALIKEYLVYAWAAKRLGFVDLPKTATAGFSASRGR